MKELVDLIDEVSKAFINNEGMKYKPLLNELYGKLLEVIPIIIASYAMPEMREYSQDALFWPAQLERVILAMQTRDVFNFVDTVYYETRSALVNYDRIIDEKKLQIF